MAKPEKDKIQTQPVTSTQDTILKLWVSVAKGDMTMSVAEKQLHDFVSSLPEDQQTEFRGKAREWGRLLLSVTEAFSQQLTVIGAGQ
jgi:hypothetical protein